MEQEKEKGRKIIKYRKIEKWKEREGKIMKYSNVKNTILI